MQQAKSSGDWHSGVVTSGGSLNKGVYGAGVSRESLRPSQVVVAKNQNSEARRISEEMYKNADAIRTGL